MYPSEKRPAPQAMTGTIAFRNGWRGVVSTATASRCAEVSDSADFFLRKLSMTATTKKQAIEEAKPRAGEREKERKRGAFCEKRLKGEGFQA